MIANYQPTPEEAEHDRMSNIFMQAMVYFDCPDWPTRKNIDGVVIACLTGAFCPIPRPPGWTPYGFCAPAMAVH